MKYKVLVADDEPSAVQYIKNIIELKCEDYEVAGTASSGREALEWLKANNADLLISDVSMPDMDGIELVTYAREYFPDLESVIISGYQDFEFLQGAIRAKVIDYLLKPVNPSQFQELLKKIKSRFGQKNYLRRGRLIRKICGRSTAEEIDSRELSELFPNSLYYAAVIRRNGMIPRFRDNVEREFFSSEASNENIYLYGRDETETLYIYPAEVVEGDFTYVMNRMFLKVQDESSYLTMVIKDEPFEAVRLPGVVRELYSKLDQSIVIGLDQKLVLGKKKADRREDKSEKQFERVMYDIRNKNILSVLNDLKILFELWEQEERSQFRVEEKILYLFYEMRNNGIMEEYDAYLFEDMFSDVVNMSQLYDNIYEFIQQYTLSENIKKKDDKKDIFDEIIRYMRRHLSEKISIQRVCREFNISQATLSRLFRSFVNMSFNSYLTNLRIDISKELLRNDGDILIKDIASEVGYDDQFYFSRIFRSYTGVSPSEYMENFSSGKD